MRSSSSSALHLGLLASLLGVLACGPAAQEHSPPLRPNFVFALIDTLRADRVGSYGHTRNTTPFIDSLAAKGLLFERARAQAPWTGASMSSLWTSRLPSEVGVTALPNESGVKHLGEQLASRLDPDARTLAMILLEAGYATIGVTANHFASGTSGLLSGFGQPFELIGPANSVVDQGLDLLAALAGGAAKPRPFFLYLHFVDVHHPTKPPEHYARLFEIPPANEAPPPDFAFLKGRDVTSARFLAYRNYKLAQYDASLRFVDDQLRRVADFLETSGLAENTVFIVASDHGEAFWDHARFEKREHLDPRGFAGIGHGQSLFGELLEVPLVMAGPGVPHARVESLVRNLDIAPTVLALAGESEQSRGMRGVDLTALSSSPLAAYSEDIAYGPEARSLELRELKLIQYDQTRQGPRTLLFDLREDPEERTDLSDQRPQELETLRDQLEALRARMAHHGGDPIELDPEAERALRSLGYLE